MIIFQSSPGVSGWQKWELMGPASKGWVHTLRLSLQGRLSDSVSWASNFGSGHYLKVHEPHMGLCHQHRAHFRSLSLSLSLSVSLSLCLPCSFSFSLRINKLWKNRSFPSKGLLIFSLLSGFSKLTHEEHQCLGQNNSMSTAGLEMYPSITEISFPWYLKNNTKLYVTLIN